MTEPTIHTLEALLEESVPEFMRALRAQTEWEWQEDDQGRTFFALEYLRLWLIEKRREAAPRAWAAVETLTVTRDPVLLNAVVVGLLEGRWPNRELALMGPRTRALYGDLDRPPEAG